MASECIQYWNVLHIIIIHNPWLYLYRDLQIGINQILIIYYKSDTRIDNIYISFDYFLNVIILKKLFRLLNLYKIQCVLFI